MARRLFASFEEDNLLTELQHVDHEISTDGPCKEEDCENIETIKESVEEAIEAQGEVQEQIKASEDLLENNKHNITEGDIQSAQECLMSSLKKLKLSRLEIARYQVSNERYKPREEKLRDVVKQLKLAQEAIAETIKQGVAKSYRILESKTRNSSKRLMISKEYRDFTGLDS